MKFQRYNSIENAYRKRTVDAMQTYFPKETYIVQEKIHGANFGVYINEFGTNFKYAKRSGFLGEAEVFNNHFEVFTSDLTEKLTALFSFCTDADNILINGEICGGHYPHEDVEKLQGQTKVQNKTWYSPQNEFVAFDLSINGELISPREAVELFQKFGILHTKILFEGSLEECLDYPNEFPIKLSQDLGYPDIEDNICEGVVIKPVNPLYFIDQKRVILKNKNEKFTEKSAKSIKVREPLPDHIKAFVEIGSQYVNENRLRAVMSKEGKFGEKEFGKLMGLTVQDVMEEFCKENESFLELDKKERKLVQKQIGSQIAALIRPNWANIIDGEF